VNPYGSFKQALTSMLFCCCLDLDDIERVVIGFQMRNAGLYQSSTSCLNVEQQTMLMEVMRIASLSGSGDGNVGSMGGT